MNEPMLDFVMRQIRDSGKPLTQIAAEAGVPYFTLQKWTRSNGTRNPRVETVQRLADYFNDRPDLYPVERQS